MKPILLFTLFLTLFSARSQQANIASGGNASGTTGTVSYSIGQIAYNSVSGTTGNVNQGVQQSFEIVTLGNDDFPEIQLTMTVYPNPTTLNVSLKMQNQPLENMHYQLFDFAGKQIESKKITTNETQISLEKFASAIYLLNVSHENKLLKTFKIIKTN